MALSNFQRTIVDDAGNVIPNATVTVRVNDSTGALANLFQDRAGTTPATNPISADGEGFVRFYVAGGRYYIKAEGASSSIEWEDYLIGTMQGQDADDVAITGGSIASDNATITGGAINGTTVGASTASTGAFTTITGSGNMNIDIGTLFVDSANDRVGVGTSSPGSKFEVFPGTAGVSSGDLVVDAVNKEVLIGRLSTTGGDNSSLVLRDRVNRRFKITAEGGDNASLVTEGALALLFGTNNTERMRIDSAGNVGIGTTSPTAKLVANSTSGSNVILSTSGSIGNGQIAVVEALTGSRTSQIGVYKHAGISNNVGIVGFSRESGTIDYLWSDNSGNLRISSNVNHSGTTSGTVVGTQTSDERIKNIEGAAPYGLAEVLQLEPVKYAIKTEPDTPRLGFTAQQVRDIIPESVFDTDEDMGEGEPNKLVMEYVQIIPVLVNAVKELAAKVESLEAQLEAK